MAAVATGVSLAAYLRTSYHPDVEYIDGELKEKSVPTWLHGVVQIILGSWFLKYRKEWGIGVASETRTQVSDARVRLSDLVVVRKVDDPHGVLVKPPLIAIEILSPDTHADLRERAGDLWAMGTEHIWLIDPDRRTADVWTGRTWQPVDGHRIDAGSTGVYVDLDWLWMEVDNG